MQISATTSRNFSSQLVHREAKELFPDQLKALEGIWNSQIKSLERIQTSIDEKSTCKNSCLIATSREVPPVVVIGNGLCVGGGIASILSGPFGLGIGLIALSGLFNVAMIATYFKGATLEASLEADQKESSGLEATTRKMAEWIKFINKIGQWHKDRKAFTKNMNGDHMFNVLHSFNEVQYAYRELTFKSVKQVNKLWLVEDLCGEIENPDEGVTVSQECSTFKDQWRQFTTSYSPKIYSTERFNACKDVNFTDLPSEVYQEFFAFKNHYDPMNSQFSLKMLQAIDFFNDLIKKAKIKGDVSTGKE